MTEEAAAPEVAPEAPTTPEASPTPPEPKPIPSAREAVTRAIREDTPEEAPEPKPEPKKAQEKPKDGEKAKPEAKAEAKPEEKSDDRPRNPDGTFAPKESAETQEAKPEGDEKAPEKPQETAGEPPTRFSPDAKAAWKDTPVSVQKEAERAIGELERGLQQYQQRFEPLKPFEELAQKQGTTIDQALAHYVGLEQVLAKDPVRGFQQIAKNLGVRFEDIAAQALGKQPEEGGEAATIHELRQEIHGLKRALGGVNQTVQSQREQATLSEINAFAAGHPRFEELGESIAKLLRTGMADGLQDAYDMAERLNPAPPPPAPAPDPAAEAAQTAATQPRKPNLSVTGAPSSGSNPAHRQPSQSAREAVTRVMRTG